MRAGARAFSRISILLIISIVAAYPLVIGGNLKPSVVLLITDSISDTQQYADA